MLQKFRFWAVLFAAFSLEMTEAKDFYVSPNGTESGTGEISAPFVTLPQAQAAVREFRKNHAEPVTVWLREGTYFLEEPLRFTPEDSGSADAPIQYRACLKSDGTPEKVVLSGGKEVSGWQDEGDGLFSAALDLPEEVGTQLFVEIPSGEIRRAIRARSPNVHPEDASQSYFFARRMDLKKHQCLSMRTVPGTLDKWILDADGKILPDAQIVTFQKWSTSFNRVQDFSPKTGRVTFSRSSGGFYFSQYNRFYVENVRAALDAPGEWYLDRQEKRIFYKPRKEEDLSQCRVTITTLPQTLVKVEGDWQNERPVAYLTFRDWTFSFTDADLSPDYPNSVQAAHTQKGAFDAVGMHHCGIERCTFAHLGEHAIRLMEGCHHNTIQQNHLYDLGGGGIALAAIPNGVPSDAARTSHNLLHNNLIHHGGNLFHAACGIFFAGMAAHNQVTHNDVSNFYWAAMQFGWCWTADSPAYTEENEIAWNHIHHIGSGVLCDLAGIYTLGNSTGTRLHHNLIHDTARFLRGKEGYGGWGIYLDQGSCNITVENNVVYNTQDGGLHLHNSCYPFNNRVYNNLFGFSVNNAMARNNTQNAKEYPFGVAIERNIIFSDNPVMLAGSGFARDQKVILNRNCYWCYTAPAEFYEKTLSQWQTESGLDTESIVADPLFQDAHRYDFRLKPNSPALALGFQEFDVSQAGLRGDESWKALAATVQHRAIEVHTEEPENLTYRETFENYEPGDLPDLLFCSFTGGNDNIQVSDEAAFEGKQSLRVTDAADLTYGYDPHFAIQQKFPEGLIEQTFALRLEKGYPLLCEWREYKGGAYKIGPVVRVDGEGAVWVHHQKQTKIPHNQWVSVAIRCENGGKTSDQSRTWTLIITCPGEKPQIFENLPLSEGFQTVDWMGFISPGKEAVSFWLDNLQVDSLKQ
ncbi:MAG: right-handed parallel beta-helix repeat-containing protein [Planctomycetia bacterium]|nr:right-handed parallel beta-helix repeat-containing protein [Planctomycetia bacterium]